MPREPSWWYAEPGLASVILKPVARLYGAIAARRLTRTAPYRSSLPVICVGNFTAGGSGKTPFTAMLARDLIARGERPVILTRGYGGSLKGPHWVDAARDAAALTGDEPLLLAKRAPVFLSRDRMAGAQAIEARGDATVIVMDDGLQNPALAKTLSFAVIDTSRRLGNWQVIPAGPLRLPLAVQAKLVDALVYNGQVNPHFQDEMAWRCPVPALHAWLQPDGVAFLAGARVVAYAGIGNPDRFFDTLRAHGATVVETLPFPDHARFTDADADRLLALASCHDAQLITTEKDHVRLSGSPKLAALAAASRTLPVEMKLHAASQTTLEALLTKALRPR